ncbi:hypothetical protein LEP1GSC050_0050 [Leptospira phage vB_LbrZ_5399-LE1]|uniref:Tetratricopeptide repeat protein n=1 Tax=Leptospira inadai serovar Lyme TaxID=293084 RepID=A0ABX4YGK6_9LEPT|nr:hypothetical protein [Leptospira inadai]AGS80683.1 hypothetical protein LEP1GSC050_0050 [Leptospira phage vB_LbrZ_5399-LE1]AGS80783.1 hypothetical protein LEP1GSC047_0919 [Leptospira phage vB_LinZ_10-LE1]PNV74314.1 hypothetical protein BES34_014100 [Leptospira inadai serovar Lyme]
MNQPFKIRPSSKRSILFLFSSVFILSCGMGDKDKERIYFEAVKDFDNNKRSEAKQGFSRIYDDDPEFQDTRMYLGKIAFYDLDFDEAERKFYDAYAERPEQIDALKWLIKAEFSKKERPMEILKANVQKFLNLCSEDLEVLYIKGILAEESKKPDIAILAYRQILAISSKSALAHERMLLISKRFRDEKGIETHEKALLIRKQRKKQR